MEILQVGNVLFTETGVSFTRAYGEENTQQIEAKQLAKALECALDYVRGRMQHCVKELEKNIIAATCITPHVVVWKSGYFTVSAYQCMEKLVTRNPTRWDDLSVAELQQIIRALHLNSNVSGEYWGDSKVLAFNLATEYILCR